MNLEAHVQNLNAKHADIEQTIETEAHRPNPDTLLLMKLKKEKLRLKEQLTRYQGQGSPAFN